MTYFEQLLISMLLNIVLLFCLFQPNICRFIHQYHLDWKKSLFTKGDLRQAWIQARKQVNISFPEWFDKLTTLKNNR